MRRGPSKGPTLVDEGWAAAELACGDAPLGARVWCVSAGLSATPEETCGDALLGARAWCVSAGPLATPEQTCGDALLGARVRCENIWILISVSLS